MDQRSALAENLRVLRAKQNLNIKDAASKVGITRETLRDLENGVRDPYPPTLAKIARGYGVPFEDLLGKALTPLGEAPEGAEDDYEAPEFTDDEIARAMRAVVDRNRHPVVASTISFMDAVCDGIEHRVDQEGYGLRDARHDYGAALEAVGLHHALTRELRESPGMATARQREILDQLGRRSKEIRRRTAEAFQRCWDEESDPDKVVSIFERRKLEELEESVDRSATG